MKYILSSNSETIEFDYYQDQLKGYVDRLPKQVADFAMDEDRYMLTHPNSLHDAWLEEFKVIESRGQDDSPSTVTIKLVLLGQMHDRRIEIIYEKVRSYFFLKKEGMLNQFATAHGDVYTHEVRISENDDVIHEIQFDETGGIEIECEVFSVRDILFSD